MRHHPRALLLLTLFLALSSGFGRPLCAQPLPELELELIAGGLAQPTSIAHAGDERLFLALRDGRILVFEKGGSRLFVDLSDRVGFDGVFGGLYSLVFDPAHAENGRFYVLYVDLDGKTVISRLEVLAGDSGSGDPASEKVLLTVDEDQDLHDGNHLAFGRDGYLYASTGDSGNTDPACSAQSLDDLEGKILRLDVHSAADAPPYWGAPPTNPFVDQGFPAELVWAYGLRNPWRFSFDRLTGDLWIGDPGEDAREEIDFQPAMSAGGQNYGWKVMEGTLCLGDATGCAVAPPPCGSPEYTAPVLEYESGDDCAVIGGYVYRGAAIPGLQGHYLYGDFCSGRVWAARPSGGGFASEETALRAPLLVTFGEDAAGELYLATQNDLYRIRGEGAEPGGDCAADAKTLCLNDGRFEVTLDWRTLEGATGQGNAIPLSPDSGYFWFFDKDNPEIFVKVLRACSDPFNHYWVFAAGLTDVETHLVVRDTRDGGVRRYDKPLGVGFDPIRDTTAFDACP